MNRREISARRRCARIALFIAAIAVPLLRLGAHNGAWQVTWTNDAEPIVQTRCLRALDYVPRWSGSTPEK